MNGAAYSFGDFYVGFGLFVTAAYLLLAWQCWTLGSFSGRMPTIVPRAAWPVVFFFGASLMLALRYFSILPALLSALIILCLVIGIRQTPKENPA